MPVKSNERLGKWRVERGAKIDSGVAAAAYAAFGQHDGPVTLMARRGAAGLSTRIYEKFSIDNGS